jgi:mono/diheme cytochrome c family protein
VRVALLFLALATLGAAGPLQERATTAPGALDDPAGVFLAKHCTECHGAEKKKGKIRLDTLAADFSTDAARKPWLAVKEQITSGAMPPEKAKTRPSQAEIDALLHWIDGKISAVETARRAKQGRAVLRRLNRVEYENTVRDLLNIDVPLQDLLPMDTAAHGFDNVGEALHSSSFLMERYLDAADTALTAAIANIPKPWTLSQRINVKEEKSLKLKGDVYRATDDGVAIFSSWVSANICVTLWNFTTKFPGKYHVRMSGYGTQTGGKPSTFYVLTGTMAGVTEQKLVGYFDVAADKPTVIDFTEHMDPRYTLRIVAEGLPVTPPTVQKVGAENYKGPGLVLQWVEVEGPLMDSWPPASHRRIFGDMPQAPTPENKNRLEVVSKNPEADAERILKDFARRAFRRTVNDDDLRPFLNRVKAKLANGYSFEQALKVGLKSVLVSPEFLFLRETPGKLDDFALASRLSYFLWSSMPDEELLRLAAEHKLSAPDTLREQVERLLKSPKAAAFTKNFAGQWLNLRSLDSTMPDPTLYPEFNDGLKESMAQEPVLFFEEVLQNDLSLTQFVASDFSMINAPLAALYGIPGVEGRNYRKVPLPPESHRGGVLTMAAVLKVTANGTNTSPILRGAWVLDRILGTPPPKPTVDVEAVEPDIRGATTIREQLAKHRSRPECASCHAKIDPPGFALESFDVIGGWRENYRSVGKGEPVNGRRYKKGPAVDCGDVLPDGRRFKDIDEFKQLLLKDPDQLARALTQKLLVYATGGAPSIADRSEIEAIVRAIQPKNYGFRSLVHEIVQSALFRQK